ncbi:helix-turn-helix transcriptional regulator [Streptomyces sp. A7024]|uniref:Helix-turn-helix transcriptional regulator n=1 Tax=Streptomyces coryli TaxID=1128680 RepID=A0A6G4U392_9ACTN|nr:helix-turn-helix domain-containing protein [Streptomyces coryli]NGN65701.1 helix-turn-helix transcriptional regulator [Streptomyces coryli]
MPSRDRRRSYDQYCGIARALDAVGDRWSLLIVRELLAGPRRYTDLHTELPGVSTDMLAARLKDLERESVVERRKLPPPANASVYDLTERGRELLPVLDALATWGAPALAEQRPTDAVRAHWLAFPLREQLRAALAGADGPDGSVTVNVEFPHLQGAFHIRLGEAGPPYGDGLVADPDAVLHVDEDAGGLIASGKLTADILEPRKSPAREVS